MALDILIKNVGVWGLAGPHDRAIAGGRFVDDAQGAMLTEGSQCPVSSSRNSPRKASISEPAPFNVSGAHSEAIETLWEIKRNDFVDEIAERASHVLVRAGVASLKLLRKCKQGHPTASRIIDFSISAKRLAIALLPRSWPINISACASRPSSRTVT